MNNPCRILFSCLVLCAGVSACSGTSTPGESAAGGTTATTGGSNGLTSGGNGGSVASTGGASSGTLVNGGSSGVGLAGSGGSDVGTSTGGQTGSGGATTGGETGSGGMIGRGGAFGTGGSDGSVGTTGSGGSTSATGAGGMFGTTGGAFGTGGISGAGGTSGGSGGGDAGVRDAPGAQMDALAGGTGGGAGGIGGGGGATSAGGPPTTGGATASGGSSGNGGTWGGTAPSCRGLAATCGPSGNDDCCKSLLVPGGTFYRSYDGVDFTDKSYPATVADFYLDKYEITVGRFRQFVNSGMGTQANPPAAGAGAHPLITGSGWNSAWNTNLSANTNSLESAIKCYADWQTWTDTAGSNESQPMNCLDWYTAFAFCAWDGGRLATEAEWNYAASGGNEQRYYPWSIPATSTTIDDSYAVYCGGPCSGTQNVGSKSPKGDGKWGQSDLAGNVFEWTLDWYASPYSTPCSNCAELASTTIRVCLGGFFLNGASDLRSSNRGNGDDPESLSGSIGARCARTSP